MPFRDAGYSQADYVLTIQDVVYGVWKAKEEGICSLKDFSLEEYVNLKPPTISSLLTFVLDTRGMSALIWATLTGLRRISSLLHRLSTSLPR